MARVMTAPPIAIPGKKNHTLRKQLLGDGTFVSSSRCARSDRRRRGAVTRAYVGEHFETLGVRPGTSPQEIKTAYRRLALQYHPDVCKGDHCDLKFKQIKTAYDFAMNLTSSSYGNYEESISCEGLMGVNDDSWEDWEEWMGWEGAGIRDYSSHINTHL